MSALVTGESRLTEVELRELRAIGSEVLYREAFPLEEALADVEAFRWLIQPAELITENLDPYKVQSRNLPALAFEMGVTLWYDDWPEWKKRRWLAEQWLFKAKVGTDTALRMALDMVDARLVEVVAPPQGMFYAGSVDPIERAAYLDRLPEIRIYTGRETRPDDGGLIWADGFFNDGFFTEDLGPELYGRKARYHYRGTETPLKHISISYRDETRDLVAYEQIIIPGDPGNAVFFGDGFFGDGFYNTLLRIPQNYTLATDGRFTITRADAQVTVLAPSLEPLYPFAETGSITGDPGEALFYSGTFWSDRYWTPDDAEDLVFTRIRLFDPEEPAPIAPFGDFYNDARYGIPVFTAELLIEATRPVTDLETFFSDGFYNDTALTPPDLKPQERAEAAVLAAKKMTDRLLWSFETTQAQSLANTIPLDGSFTFNNRIQRHL